MQIFEIYPIHKVRELAIFGQNSAIMTIVLGDKH